MPISKLKMAQQINSRYGIFDYLSFYDELLGHRKMQGYQSNLNEQVQC